MPNQETLTSQIDSILESEDGTTEQLQAAISKAEVFFGADGGASIILWNEDTGKFDAAVSTVPGQDSRDVPRRVRQRRGATRWIFDEGESFCVEDIRDDPFGANSLLIEANNNAYAGQPIISDNRSVGVFYAMHRSERSFSKSYTDAMAVFASIVAPVVGRFGFEPSMPFKVLVVDDAKLLRTSLMMTLKSFPNIQASEAESADHAIDQLENTAFDLIFLDIQLGVANGFDVARQIRLGELNRSTPICFITGNSGAVRTDLIAELQPATVLLKPFGRSSIFKLVESLKNTP